MKYFLFALSFMLQAKASAENITITCEDLGSSQTKIQLQLDIAKSDNGSRLAPDAGTGSAFTIRQGQKIALEGLQNRTLEVVGLLGEDNITQYKLSGANGDLILKVDRLGMTVYGFGRLQIPSGALSADTSTELSVGCEASQ